jgi:hypothetical protein
MNREDFDRLEHVAILKAARIFPRDVSWDPSTGLSLDANAQRKLAISLGAVFDPKVWIEPWRPEQLSLDLGDGPAMSRGEEKTAAQAVDIT